MVLLLHLLLASLSALSNSGGVQAQQPEECRHYAPPAVIKGRKIFVESTGEYLPIRGINYYPRPNAGELVLGNSQDFYTEAFRSSWERDIEQFKALNLNAIRLYAVNPGQNHDAFMCALKAAGIYVLVGLAADCENCAVQWQDPPDCYPQNLKQRGQLIIQQFAKYENVLGFSAGNEVALSAVSYIGNLPCQKKFLRDMREWMHACVETDGMRHIPVGVVFADHERGFKAPYYNCRSDPNDEFENAEFIGINSYLHCDGTATDIDQLIGYKTLLAGFQTYGMTIPSLWTEFGCLSDSFSTIDGYEAQRNFLQADALFSDEYRELFNGGFVFEYSTEKVYSEQSSPWPFTNFGPGNYGVGYFEPENCNHLDIPCNYVPFPQFQNLAARYAEAANAAQREPTMDEYNPPENPTLPECPTEYFETLGNYNWPTDSSNVQPLTCPVRVPVYCAGIPSECVTVIVPGSPTTPSPTISIVTTAAPTTGPITTAPTALQNTNVMVTAQPTATTTTSTPTISPVASTLDPTSSMGSTGDQPDSVQEVSSDRPSLTPSESPSTSNGPSSRPTLATTTEDPSASPTSRPSAEPSQEPSVTPTVSDSPTVFPTMNGTSHPSELPSLSQTNQPSVEPTSVFEGMTQALRSQMPTTENEGDLGNSIPVFSSGLSPYRASGSFGFAGALLLVATAVQVLL